MQNDAGERVDLYIPRKCSATNRLINAKDHASVQLNLAHIDKDGRYNGSYTSFALSGFVRSLGESDSSLNRLCREVGMAKLVVWTCLFSFVLVLLALLFYYFQHASNG